MRHQDETPHRTGIFALPALFAAMMAGFGIGLARRPYRPRDEIDAPVPTQADPAIVTRSLPVDEAPAPAAAPPVEAVEPAPAAMVAPDPVPPAPTASSPGPVGEPRKRPTPLGERVVAALEGSAPLRKHEIAKLVGIGRGSAVRIVDRLIDEGWMRHHGGGLYGIA